MFTQNKKMKASSNNDYVVVNWTLPALRSATGLVTCPAAGSCATGCYAQQGAYRWSTVAAAHERNLAISQSEMFADLAIEELTRLSVNAQRRGKRLVVRIHDSGDFYSASYLMSWIKIMRKLPDVLFYAYTKQVKLFKAVLAPGEVENFTVIFSEGGVFDRLIDVNVDRHSRVFPDRESLLAAGYADSSEDDLVAGLGQSNKIGLVYHGAKSKTWTTSAAG